MIDCEGRKKKKGGEEKVNARALGRNSERNKNNKKDTRKEEKEVKCEKEDVESICCWIFFARVHTTEGCGQIGEIKEWEKGAMVHKEKKNSEWDGQFKQAQNAVMFA